MRTYKLNPDMIKDLPSRWKTLIEPPGTLRTLKEKKNSLNESPALPSSPCSAMKPDAIRSTVPPSQYTKHLYSKHLDAFWEKIHEDSKLFVDSSLLKPGMSTGTSKPSSHLIVQ
jgi:hypothetical protein